MRIILIFNHIVRFWTLRFLFRNMPTKIRIFIPCKQPTLHLTRGLKSWFHVRGCIQKFPDWVDNEINNNNKHSLRSSTKGYGGKTQWTDSQNSDTIAPSGKGLYHLQFSLQEARPETFGYNLVGLHMFVSFHMANVTDSTTFNIFARRWI
jgi:hypothetical protein